MTDQFKNIELKGRVFLTFDIYTLTGLHIGGSDTGIEIGGVDKTVIRDPLSNQPYIPGSSLKGKMRSLLEKYNGLKQNQRIGQGYIHSCGAEYSSKQLKEQSILEKVLNEYNNCEVCMVFGLPGERPFATPARLFVRDVQLSENSARDLEGRTDLPYTEVKTEVAIDRVTSAANPRQMERVPAGVVFGGYRIIESNGEKERLPQPAELVYSIYGGTECDPAVDIERLSAVVKGLQLLEDDYLGGLGTRGSGKVRLENIKILVRKDPLQEAEELGAYDDLSGLSAALGKLQKRIREILDVN